VDNPKLTEFDRWKSAELDGVVGRRARSKAPLDRLEAAVGVVDELRDVGEEVLDRFVAETRAAGHSWADVGAVLGVSKQAAQQRFPASGTLRRRMASMSDAVLSAMRAALEEAQALGHNYIGTEHLLLGLVAQTDDPAAEVLAGLGVTRAVILAQTREIVGTGPPLCEPVRVAPRLKRTLELARAEARRLGHRCVGTEHVLLGIARLDEGVAARILRDLGGSPDRVQEEVAKRLGLDADQIAGPPHRRRRLLRR